MGAPIPSQLLSTFHSQPLHSALCIAEYHGSRSWSPSLTHCRRVDACGRQHISVAISSLVVESFAACHWQILSYSQLFSCTSACWHSITQRDRYAHIRSVPSILSLAACSGNKFIPTEFRELYIQHANIVLNPSFLTKNILQCHAITKSAPVQHSNFAHTDQTPFSKMVLQQWLYQYVECFSI